MPILLQTIESQWRRIGQVLNHDLRSGSRRMEERVAVKHHDNLIEALRRHDSAAACAALRGDIESAAPYIASAEVLVNADRAEDAAATLVPVMQAVKAGRAGVKG